jgi:hypothetical protein
MENFGRTAPRDQERMFHNVIACNKREAFVQGSESDEAIHPSVMPRDGLLRSARNDGGGGKPGDDRARAV